ncbi:MAG: SelT/SelW/SelH family protein [Opitutaceae bacterium]|nr:SelT/SelW/SelH family protein [Cytophagales bacterium]
MQKPRITIEYCTQCNWLLRSAWMAQELLTTFSQEIGELVLKPGTGGIFSIYVNDELIFDRKSLGSFPDIKVLKQKIRDIIAPEKLLGHSDTKH